MIAPASLSDLIAADQVAALKSAIVARLIMQLPGVKVISHPGKVDISQIVAKTVVAAPGVAVGWTRIRPDRLPDGTWSAVIEFAAYIVVEDKVIDSRRVERETLGYAIGLRLLAILGDPDEQLWGRGDVLPPQGADLRPFFTLRDAADGVAYYALTWSQTLTALGGSLWDDGCDLEGLTGQRFAGADDLAAAMAELGLDYEPEAGT